VKQLESKKCVTELKQGQRWLSFTVAYHEVFSERGSLPFDGMFAMHIDVERQKGNCLSPFIAFQ